MVLIDRGRVMLDYLENVGRKDSYKAKFEALCKAVDEAPSIDYAPVRHGEWIEDKLEYPEEVIFRYKCSECGRTELVKEPYCHCGAKMDGGK